MKAVELGSLLERIAGGGTPSKAVSSYFHGDIPFATVKDFKCRRPGGTTDHITTDALANSASELVPADTLLLTTRMTIGRAARFPMPVAINQDIKAIFPKACLDKDYLEWFLFSKAEELVGKGSGTTVKGIRLGDIRGLLITLLSMEEQRRVAGKLDRLFTRSQGARDELNRIPGLVKRYKQAILASAFRGDLTAHWRATHPQTGSVGNFVSARLAWTIDRARKGSLGRDERSSIMERDADLQRTITERSREELLPDTWGWCGLGEVFGVYVGATPSRRDPSLWQGEVPWVSSGEVAFCRVSATEEKITAKGLANTSTRVHPPGQYY